jgi:aryl-alcohol dehydrogenase-like predicted oxidoreductase
MEQSFRLLRTERIDLMQIHNLLDWQSHLPTLREWKTEGRIRYIGITHYTPSAYDEVEAVLKAEHSIFCKSITPSMTVAWKNAFCRCAASAGGGDLQPAVWRRWPARAAQGQAAAGVGVGRAGQQLAATGAEVLLSHPAVTCVIPGTGNPRYMTDNAGAGFGPMLTDAQRHQLIALLG